MPLRRGPLPELRVDTPPLRILPAARTAPSRMAPPRTASPQTQTRYREQRLHDDKQWFEQAVLQRAPPAGASWGSLAESERFSPPLRPLSPRNKPMWSPERTSPARQLPISRSAPCLALYPAGPAASVMKLNTHEEKPQPEPTRQKGVQFRPQRPGSYRTRGGAYASARLQCDEDRSYKNLRELNRLKATLAYAGWRLDADEAEGVQQWLPAAVPAILDTMRRKQQVHSGDRSHRFIRKLDALTPTLSYDGWRDDARVVEWPGTTDNGVFEGLGMNEADLDKLLERMHRKQAFARMMQPPSRAGQQ